MKKNAVRILLIIAVAVLAAFAIFILMQHLRYSVKKGTISGVVTISEAITSGSGGRPLYLNGDDGKKYRLKQTDNREAFLALMRAREGDRLSVTGRYRRLRKSKTLFYDRGWVKKGPDMTADPIDSLEGAEFVLIAESVKVFKKTNEDE